MGVRKRELKKGGKVLQQYFVDFRFKHANGRVERIRLDSPVNTQRGTEQYERDVRQQLQAGTFRRLEEKEEPIPTVQGFVQRFLTYSENNNKPSTLEGKKAVLDHHILPFFGKKRLDEIGLAEVEDFKAAMRKKLSNSRPRKEAPTKWAIKKRYGAERRQLSDKSINNVLAVFRRMLSLAYEQGVIAHVPRVKLFKTEKPPFDFLTFDEADRLLAAADPEWRTVLLVALKTGLRLGELIGLQWTDIDLARGKLHVRRTVWKGKPGLPKGGRARTVDLPYSAVEALKSERHLKGPHVFCQSDGTHLTPGMLKAPLERALRRSGISRPEGRIGWHDLRHTYGSHLAMRGVPLKVIQELMGHATIEMTMRYAHLSTETKRDAVQVLDQPAPLQAVGNGWAMEVGAQQKSP